MPHPCCRAQAHKRSRDLENSLRTAEGLAQKIVAFDINDISESAEVDGIVDLMVQVAKKLQQYRPYLPAHLFASADPEAGVPPLPSLPGLLSGVLSVPTSEWSFAVGVGWVGSGPALKVQVPWPVRPSLAGTTGLRPWMPGPTGGPGFSLPGGRGR